MPTLGIHLDGPYLQTTLLKKGRKGVQIGPFLEFKANGEDVKQFYMTLPTTWIENFNYQIVAGLPSKDLLVRSLELKIGKSKYRGEAISFHAEAMSHLKAEEILTLPFIQKEEKESTQALLFTAPREAIKTHLLELEKLQLEPDALSAIPLALFDFIRWKLPEVSEALLIHIGSEETTCILIENGLLKKSHAIPIGIETLLAALFEDRKKVLLQTEIESAAKQMDLLLFKPTLNPSLHEKIEEFRQEVGKVRYFFSKTNPPLFFTGRTDALLHLPEFLAQMEISPSPFTPEEQKFAVSIGLSLSSSSLQFRRQEFFPQKNWKKLGTYALSLIGASLFLSLLLFTSSLRSSVARKTEMLHFLKIGGEGSMEQKIDRWISTIEAHNKEYPYLVQAPKVSEVLAWLSSHPLLEEFKGEADPFDLLEMRYFLEKFPQINASKEPYLAKVELEFRLKNPTNARKFHEALRNGDDLVNPQLEIQWDVLDQSYRISFFLKNRSPYVS